MIQFNLLPDVKKEYVKAKQLKNLIISISTVISIMSIVVVVILFSVVQVAQKKNITDLTEDIKTSTSELQSIDDLNKILTVQNQLSLLPGLHIVKPETSRVFGYLPLVLPQKAKVSSLNLDLKTNLLVLQGNADKIVTINAFVDNLKAVRYKIDGDNTSQEMKPFTQVSTQLSDDDEKASFKIDITFDPVIFDNTKEIVMILRGQTQSTKPVVGGQ